MSSLSTWAEVSLQASRLPGLQLLGEDDTIALAARFASEFVADAGSRWWWDTLRPDAVREVIGYAPEDAWAVIARHVPDRPIYVLLVTDEEPRPAGGLRGSLADLATLVSESPFFEYVVTDTNVTFGVFDTHHNNLVLVWTTPDIAK